MKITLALAQINSKVGDFKHNKKKILEYINKAKDKGADIVLFPELTITGYLPEDLIFRYDFINENLKTLDYIKENMPDNIIAIIGFMNRENNAIYNSAAILYNKEIKGIYNKNYLPNYGVFDEYRYFTRGNETIILQLNNNIKIGVNICEDIWYPEGPVRFQSALKGSALILVLNASPFDTEKIYQREKILKARAIDSCCYIAYTNLVGGQDEILFDGHSFIVDYNGDIIARAKGFKQQLLIKEINLSHVNQLKNFKPHPIEKDHIKQNYNYNYKLIKINKDMQSKNFNINENDINPIGQEIENIYKALILGIKDYISKNEFKKVVIGLSGGIDSSLVATLAVDALGKENVLGILLPTRFTSKESNEDAILLAKNLGIKYHIISIEEIFKKYLSSLKNYFKDLPFNIAEENLQSRIRGNILMAFSNKFGYIVLVTGNKSELSTGYFTLYGDSAGGFAPLKDVYKTTVYKLAEYRNKINYVIPENILKKEPTAELRQGQKDTDSLPPYEILDKILKLYIEQEASKEYIISLGFNKDIVEKVAKQIKINEYKRKQAPVGIKITTKAFGRERRYPITNAFY